MESGSVANSDISLQSFAMQVMQHYPPEVQGDAVALGNHGGFSGAHLWRIDRVPTALCLKAWPIAGRGRAELSWIHQLIARAANFPWMPRVVPTTRGETVVNVHGWLWDLTTWMPGDADFARSPTAARLESACAALASLHVAWSETESSVGICPGVRRRWQAWRTWTNLLQSGWRPRWASLDPYALIAEPLFHAIQRLPADVPRLLTPWLTTPMPLQPCVCDPWHDHLLFKGDVLTGLIDFGSAKIDHVAVDLARLLGSLVGADRDQWLIGVNSYRRVRPFTDDDWRLARDLDYTGTLIAATHWLRWLYHEGQRYESPAAVLSRLQHLATRLI